MPEAITTNQPALLIPLVALIGTAVVFVVWILAAHWKQVQQLQIESALKQDMLNRGMSPADVERVLWASSNGPAAPADSKESISDNEYALIEKMLDDERPVEEIERLLRALKGNAAPSIDSIQEAIRRG